MFHPCLVFYIFFPEGNEKDMTQRNFTRAYSFSDSCTEHFCLYVYSEVEIGLQAMTNT